MRSITSDISFVYWCVPSQYTFNGEEVWWADGKLLTSFKYLSHCNHTAPRNDSQSQMYNSSEAISSQSATL